MQAVFQEKLLRDAVSLPPPALCPLRMVAQDIQRLEWAGFPILSDGPNPVLVSEVEPIFLRHMFWDVVWVKVNGSCEVVVGVNGGDLLSHGKYLIHSYTTGGALFPDGLEEELFVLDVNLANESWRRADAGRWWWCNGH